MQNLWAIRGYINYIRNALTRYDVHSPFLFDLVSNVFADKKHYSAYDKVENLKTRLLKDKTEIEVEDYGAGSKKLANNRRSIRQITRYSSKSKKHGRLLYRLVQYVKPVTVLELGTSLGLSTAYMALAIESAKIITIEGASKVAEKARQNFEHLGLQNIVLFTGKFDEVLPDVWNQIPKLGMAFIDGNHQEAPTKKYFEQCLKKSDTDTILVFDDIHWSHGMENAWNYIVNHPEVTLSIDIYHMGIVFLNKALAKQHFIIRF
jgi:predicted O-methyltransferase YrrM